MSNEAVGYAIKSRIGDSTRKLILMVMADAHNSETGVMWHSVGSIATKAECSTRTVQRHLGQLLAEGYLREGDQSFVDGYPERLRPIVYAVATSDTERDSWAGALAPRRAAAEARGSLRGDNLSPHSIADRGDTGDQSDVTPVTDRGDTGVTQTVREPELEPEPLVDKSTGSAAFDAFWAAYPRKVGKPAARKAFKAATKRVIESSKSHIDYDDAGAAHWIIAKTELFAEDPNLPPSTFIPHPTTWLNRDGWDDGPLPSRTGREELHTAASGYDRDGESRVMSAAEWKAGA